DQRLRDALERLAPEPPPHEGPQALVPAAAPRQHEVEPHPELAGPREEAGGEERAEPGGGEELEALGQRVEAPPAHDERAAEAIVGPHQPILDAEPAAQGERPGLLGEE